MFSTGADDFREHHVFELHGRHDVRIAGIVNNRVAVVMNGITAVQEVEYHIYRNMSMHMWSPCHTYRMLHDDTVCCMISHVFNHHEIKIRVPSFTTL